MVASSEGDLATGCLFGAVSFDQHEGVFLLWSLAMVESFVELLLLRNWNDSPVSQFAFLGLLEFMRL